MDIALTLYSMATRGLVRGATEALGVRVMDTVIAFLTERFIDQSQRLTLALQRSNDRAWRALEIALAGDSWWERTKVAVATAQERGFRQQVQAFLDSTPLAGLPSHGEEFRSECLRQLRAARKAGLLSGGAFDAKALAEKTVSFARFANPQKLLEQDWQALGQIAAALREKHFSTLADLLEMRPADAPPLLATAVRCFFRREVEADRQLFQGLAFAQLEKLQKDQEAGFGQLAEAFTQHGQRLEELLGDVQTIVAETHDDVLDIKAELQQHGKQLQELGRAVLQVLQQHQLENRQLNPGDSLSIRNDAERKAVRELIAQYRSLPEEKRRELPALLNAMGKLEVVSGDFESAQRDFEQLADIVADPHAQAEAHANAYQAALEQRDWAGALQFLLKAAELDPEHFELFPLGKYAVERILGAGGFGVAFLCRNRLSGSRVVIKSVRTDGLDRDLTEVFREAQALESLDHPSIIRLRDCDYADTRHTRPYIVMDYFEGPTLHDYVAEHGPLASADAIAVASMVAEGLKAAHARGILHRDIKPGNLLVRGDEPAWQVKVIDFGLAMRSGTLESTARSQRDNTVTGESIAGTIDYAAPEQMGRLSGVAVGPYSDVYGFGKTCCYALFQTPQPTWQHWKQLAPPLAELLSKCLEEDPQQRPQDFAAVLDRLQKLQAASPAVLADDDIPVARLAPDERPRHTAVRRANRTTTRPRRNDEPRTRRAPPRPRRRPWLMLTLTSLAGLLVCWCLFPSWSPTRFLQLQLPMPPRFSLGPLSPAEPLPEADIPAAVAEMKTAHPQRQNELARRFAVTPLVEKHHESVADGLERLLTAAPGNARTEAASALAVWGRKESGPPLIKLIGDFDGRTREAAMNALGKLKIVEAAEPIAARVSDVWDGKSAISALRSIGLGAEKYVIPLLKRNDCRRAVSSLLKDIGSKESLPALQEVASCGDHFDEQAARDAIKALGGIASWEAVPATEIPAVLEALRTANAIDKSALLCRLAATTPIPERKDAVAAAFSEFASSKDAALRGVAVRGLVKWGMMETIAVENLLPLARDRDPNIRRSVVTALARTKDARAAEVIASGLGDVFEQDFTAARLKEMGAAAEKAVIPYLTTGNIRNQKAACSVLGAIGTRNSVEALQRLARDSQMMRRFAEEALKSLGVLQANEIAALAESLPGQSAEQQLESLRRLGVTPPVEERRSVVARSLEMLTESPSEKVRLAALRTLVEWGDRDSMPILGELLSSSDAKLRALALDALAATKDARAAEAIVPLLSKADERRAAGAALQTIGAAAEKAVLPILKTGDRGTQVEVCNILKTIGTGASISTLQDTAKSSDEVVRFAAEQTLQALLARIGAKE